MRILDENGNEIVSPDYDLGYVVPDKILVAHHDAVQAVKEVGHYDVIAEYPNGGKDVKWVVDIPGVAAQDAWDEYEDILRYIPYTEEELAAIEAERKAREDHKPVTWAELDAAYQSGYAEGYTEGVNSVYEQ